MSQDNQGAPGASPAQQQSIPLDRFNEVLAQKRAVEDQNNTLQHLVRSLAPQPAAQPVQLPEFLQRLKEENPAAFQAYQSQGDRLQQLEATVFTSNDNQDRIAYLQHFGEVGKAHLDAVEGKLEDLRRRGQHGWTRGLILTHMVGQQALQRVASPQAPQAPAPSAPAPQGAPARVLPPQGYAPSMDPSAASTTNGSSAPAVGREETLEEMEARLGDVEL